MTRSFTMLKTCKLCGKGELTGKVVSRKGLAKKKGGTGSKICRSNKRTFFANLQPMRILIKGHPRRVYVCAKCIKKGDFSRA
jgi:large subunit ribosomal protein L28